MTFKHLPEDILERIGQDYEWHDALWVTSILSCLYSQEENPYSELGFIRSALYLAKGRQEQLLEELRDDYRNVLLAAEQLSGSYGHYFRIPFPEIEELERRTAEAAKQEYSDYQALPEEFWNEEESL